MNKDEFLHRLRRKLRVLPKEEIDNAVQYYEEYFEDSGLGEEQTTAQLGSPAAAASQILADYAINRVDGSGRKVKRRLPLVWFILLAIFASPIALPIGIVFVALIIVVLITAVSVLAAMACVVVSMIIGGVFLAGVGICVTLQNMPTAVFVCGLGLTAAGAGALLMIPLIMLCRVSCRGIMALVSKILKKVRKVPAEREEKCVS